MQVRTFTEPVMPVQYLLTEERECNLTPTSLLYLVGENRIPLYVNELHWHLLCDTLIILCTFH